MSEKPLPPKATDEASGDDALASAGETSIPPAPPPIGTVKPIRDVPDEFVFRFELGPAILAQLLEKLRHIPLRPITTAIDEAKHPGFYHIYLDGEPKYIGKTSRAIGQRLREHVGKLRGRQGIDIDKVGCKYAFVEDPSLIDVSEGELISYFSQHGLAEWNTTGFGSKVPGYGRARQVASDWSEQYPPDLDHLIEAGSDDPIELYELVRQVAREAPTTFSVPTQHRGAFLRDHPKPLSVPREERPFREWAAEIEARLADGWFIDRQAPGWYIAKRDE